MEPARYRGEKVSLNSFEKSKDTINFNNKGEINRQRAKYSCNTALNKQKKPEQQKNLEKYGDLLSRLPL